MLLSILVLAFFLDINLFRVNAHLLESIEFELKLDVGLDSILWNVGILSHLINLFLFNLNIVPSQL